MRFLTIFGYFELTHGVDPKFDEDPENVSLFCDRSTIKKLFDILKPEVKPEVKIQEI